MKYIGNKTRLLPFIDYVLDQEKIGPGRALDPFSGTASVAVRLKQRGHSVVAGDIQYYAYVQAAARVAVSRYPDFRAIGARAKGAAGHAEAVRILDRSEGVDGFFFRNYAPGGSGGGRQYFWNPNARRIDGVRLRLSEWRSEGRLCDDGYHLLLASLIDAADFVANMSGTYGAYLKIWRSMALKPLALKPLEIVSSRRTHRAVCGDANQLVRETPADLLYLDPPYTDRQYATNFHVLETLAVDDSPELRGKTGLRPTAHQLSDYARRGKAASALGDLLTATSASRILLSYSDEGLIPHDRLVELLGPMGRLRVYDHVYRRFRTERDHARRRYKRPDDKVVERVYALSR